jgi:hypothetical protein
MAQDFRDDWQALRREVRRLFEERRDAGVWPKNKDGNLSKAGSGMAFDWLLGIHVGLTLSGNEAGLGPLVFLASVRGVEDATTIMD